MANPIVNLLCGLWSCIRGSLRIILFFACLIFALVQLKSVIDLYNDNSTSSWLRENVLDLHNGTSSYITAYVILFVALLGVFGAFFNHQLSLKIFAVLVAVSAVLMTVSLTYAMAGDDLEEIHDKLMKVMKNYAKDYDWSKAYSQDKPNKAWDLVQKNLYCCGLDSPKDWSVSRPTFTSGDLYPGSCCMGDYSRLDKLCPKDSIYNDGCKQRIQAIEAITLMGVVLFVAFQFLLSIIAYILIIPQASDNRSVSSSHRSVLPTTQEYQRFDGSVYVRQPGVAPSYQQQEYPPVKTSAPPMYPNVHDIEKKGASAPPPSYY